MSENHLSELAFRDLELPDAIRKGIDDAGFEYCTPIQSRTLPIALEGRDVAGQAQTGTGKTAAFLIALFDRLLASERPDDKQSAPRAVILAPTRELAVQIAADAETLGSHTGLELALAYGGKDYDKQRDHITAGIDVLIGTPGRLIDYFKQGVFNLKHVEVMVLDEADRMFDLGFIKDIRYVLRRLPPPTERLNMLFSATLSHRVMELAYEHMNDPELIRIEPEKVTADRVRQVIYYPSNEEKLPLLIKLLRERDARRTMVFVNTKREAERLEDTLRANGINAQAISGDVPQRKRARRFPERRTRRADRHRRRLSRPARARREPRVQLRPAPGPRGLRAPHRPHGARGRLGRRHQLRLRAIRSVAARHRGLHRQQDTGGELRSRVAAEDRAPAPTAAQAHRRPPRRRRQAVPRRRAQRPWRRR